MSRNFGIGFTGTRFGMTDAQFDALAKLLDDHMPNEFHHGDCVGADAQAHTAVRIYREKSRRDVAIHIRPSESAELRAFCVALAGDTVHAGKANFARNREIVDSTDLLIATP